MFQGKQRTFGIEHTDVVGRAQFVHLVQQGLRRQHVAQAHTGQTKFGQGAHQQHMAVGAGVAADFVQPGAAGKRLVSLIDHHQTAIGAHLGNQAVHHLRVPQIGGGVVGVGQINQRGLVLGNGSLHGGFVQCEVGRQRHTDKLQALQARAHGIHDKAGFGGQDGGTRHVTGHGQQCNQFV